MGLGKVVIIACYDPCGISTITEQLQEWKRLSAYNIRIVNLFNSYGKFGMRLPDPEVLSNADAVIIHPTACYFPENLTVLCESINGVREKKDFALVLYKQDEHVRSYDTARCIGNYRIDVVLTCVPPGELKKVYPENLTGMHVRFHHVLTGYFSDRLIKQAPRISWRDRKIDFFYRGSKQPPEIGRLGFLKYAIAKRLMEEGNRLGIRVDSSSEWECRLNGQDWIIALANSKIVLGMESGSNCFDFDGSLKKKVDEILKNSPEIDPWEENGYRFIHSRVLDLFEGNVKYGQVAPRHFEAIATFTPQALLPGEYSGILKKGRHYVEIREDMSNLKEVVEYLNDPIERGKIVECAYEEVALNNKFHYRNFVSSVDRLIAEVLQEKPSSKKIGARQRGKANVLLLCPHPAHLDPRIEWWAKFTSIDWDVGIIEVDPSYRYSIQYGRDDGVLLTVGAVFDRVPIDVFLRELLKDGIEGGRELLGLLQEIHQDVNRLRDLEGGRHASSHVWYLDYFVRISIALINAGSMIGAVDVILAVDLPTLAAAAYLSKVHNVPVVYDAQEVWAHSDPKLNEKEVAWWEELEGKLIGEVDIGITVSQGIGDWYKTKFDKDMVVVPNFSPLTSANSAPMEYNYDDDKRQPIKFLYMGNFAVNRGIDKLIEAWDFSPREATLSLMGPSSEYKAYCMKLAKELNRGERGVLFVGPVPEGELVAAASRYDIGIIPYVYAYPYKHCSPNKLTQYMMSGCAVLFHRDLSFVSSVVKESRCGIEVDFNSVQDIRKVVRWILRQKDKVVECRKNSFIAVRENVNWETVVMPVVEKMASLVDPSCDKMFIRQGACGRGWQSMGDIIYRLQTSIYQRSTPIWNVLPERVRVKLAPVLKVMLRRG